MKGIARPVIHTSFTSCRRHAVYIGMGQYQAISCLVGRHHASPWGTRYVSSPVGNGTAPSPAAWPCPPRRPTPATRSHWPAGHKAAVVVLELIDGRGVHGAQREEPVDEGGLRPHEHLDHALISVGQMELPGDPLPVVPRIGRQWIVVAIEALRRLPPFTHPNGEFCEVISLLEHVVATDVNWRQGLRSRRRAVRFREVTLGARRRFSCRG